MSDSKIIANYYNEKEQGNLSRRAESRIYHMRNFNNWIKSVLINEFVIRIRREKRDKKESPHFTVLDLGCGRGGDIKKWQNLDIDEVLFADIAEKSLEECKKRYDELRNRKKFKASFTQIDGTKECLNEKLQQFGDYHNKVDLVSSQFVLHYSFESFKQADTYLKNVSDALKTGGYFIGTTTNAYEIIRRLKAADSNKFGNQYYEIKFNDDEGFTNKLFGEKFYFQLEGVVDCPEYLVHFPTLVELAKRNNLELVNQQNFQEFFAKYSNQKEHQDYFRLFETIKVFEHFNREKFEKLNDESLANYEHLSDSVFGDKDSEIGTLTKQEWEIITLYTTFAFVKV